MRSGKPWQTIESWAFKQIYYKTAKRISALIKAKSTRARLPDISNIRDIRKLEFHVLETDIEVQKVVQNEILRLKKEFPDWEFSAKFGK